jgi:hypothetical protein
MRLRRFANFWIMLCVAAGLLLAPLTAPVVAKPASNTAATETQGMAGDMPCCPDEVPGPTKDGNCASCPLAALCTFSIPLLGPSGATLIKRDPLRASISASDDLLIEGLDLKPPDHPPRTQV